MATDRVVMATGVIAGTAITGSYIIPRGAGVANASASNIGKGFFIGEYLSGYNIRESAATPGTALVKIRDSLLLPGPIGAAIDGAAGSNNVTVGLHMFIITGVTKHGETTYGRNAGDRLEFTAAGSLTAAISGIPLFSTVGEEIVGRRLYATKAGAPATGVTPTNAQWFLTVADGSSTLAAGENGKTLPEATISLASGTSFASSGKCLVTTSDGPQVVSYTGKSSNDLTGCTGGSGTMATGGAVTQPMIADNTTTTYTLDVADGGFTATVPPTKDTAGRAVATIPLAASEGMVVPLGPDTIGAQNDGGFAVEINSGGVDWIIWGR